MAQFSNETLEKHIYTVHDYDDTTIGMGQEYMLTDTNVSLLANSTVKADPVVKVLKYEYVKGRYELELKNTGTQSALIDLPILNYDHYHVYDAANGREYEITNGTNNTICFAVDASFAGTILVRYEEPLSWRITELISILTVVSLLGYAGYCKKCRLRNKTGA